MPPRLILPDRTSWFSSAPTDVEIPVISKLSAPRGKPSWITHATTMRAIWIIFEIALFSVILVKILLQVAYH